MVDTFAAICCLFGVCLVTKLFEKGGGSAMGAGLDMWGVTAALVSAITAAGVNITIRKLKSESAATITLYAMLGSVIVSLPGFIYSDIARPGKPWSAAPLLVLQLCLTGVCSWAAQIFKTTGLNMSRSLVSATSPTALGLRHASRLIQRSVMA